MEPTGRQFCCAGLAYPDGAYVLPGPGSPAQVRKSITKKQTNLCVKATGHGHHGQQCQVRPDGGGGGGRGLGGRYGRPQGGEEGGGGGGQEGAGRTQDCQ